MLALSTLGRLELAEGDQLILPRRRTELVLLACVARRMPRPVARAELATLLWGDRDEARARHSLRQALWKLRAPLGAALEITGDTVRLGPGRVTLDLREFEEAVGAERASDAVALWKGDFLAGCEDLGDAEFRAWIEQERVGLRKQLAWAFGQLLDRAQASGQPDSAAGYALRWCEALPYDETAHRRLVEALRIAGRSSEAAAQHARFVSRVTADLGAAPSAEFAKMAEALDSAIEPARLGERGLLTPDLVGRAEALGRLHEAWQAVRGGGGGAVVILGDEGLGKSRLCREFGRMVRGMPGRATLVESRAFEAERDSRWSALRPVLAALADSPGLRAAPAAALGAAADIAPEIRERMPQLASGPAGLAPAEGVTRVLSEIGAEAPLLLILDDFASADPASLEVFTTLLRRPPPGCLLVLTARPEALASSPSESDFREGAPQVVRIELLPLDQREIELLLASMMPLAGDAAHALAGQLLRASSGNPAQIERLVAAWVEAGLLAAGPDGRWALTREMGEAPLPIPAGTRDSLLSRIERLAGDPRQLAEAAAVFEEESEPELLERSSGISGSRFAAALGDLLSRRILRESQRRPGSFELCNETLRRAVYASLAPSRRQALHRGALAALRRLPASSPRRAERIRDHAQRSNGSTARRRWMMAGAGATAVLLAGAVALGWPVALLGHRAQPTTTIAVLPFTMRGNGAYAYLGEGTVTLLSSALDGLGGLQSVDSHGLLSFVAGKPADPAQGRAAARHFGAGLFVLGDIVETNGRLEVAASLYDVAGKLQTVARASAESEAGIYGAVDAIAKQLMVSRRVGPGEEITRVAAATTASLLALKSYLAGERELRAGNFTAAIDSFQVAVSADTAFALAYYRLAIAAEWDQRDVLPEQAARQAARYGNRLTERSRALVDALLTWRSGHILDAKTRYEAIVVRYPKDVEAWFQLGEVLFHAGPLLGRPIGSAKAAWRQVLTLEPDNRFAMVHLARIAATENDSAALAVLVPRVPDLEVDDDLRLLELAAWRALLFRNESEAARVRGHLRPGSLRLTMLWELASYSRDLDGSEQFVRRLSAQPPPYLESLLLQLDLARGKWRQAEGRTATASWNEASPLVSRAYVASLPFTEVPRSELLRLRAQLLAWKPPPSSRPAEEAHYAWYHAGVYPELQRYLAGALSVRLGEVAAASGYAEALGQTAHPPRASSLVRDLALSLKAMVARQKGQPRAALRLLDSLQPTTTRDEIFNSPLYSRALQRYQLAELLQEVGRGEDALPWLESMAQLSPYELVFLAPSHLRRAEIYESLGRPAEAAAQYTRFIELWKDADPESQPLVAQARARLATLSSGEKAPGESRADPDGPPGQPLKPTQGALTLRERLQ